MECGIRWCKWWVGGDVDDVVGQREPSEIREEGVIGVLGFRVRFCEKDTSLFIVKHTHTNTC